MNTGETMSMLTDKDDDGNYKIPFIIYSDAYYSETVSFADLVLPDTTYLERHDCISLLDRPISHADGPGDAIRHPVLEPDRDVRPFQTVLIDLGARLGLPGLVNDDGSAKYRDYADYIVNHERAPGIGPLAGWRGVDGNEFGRGEPNPDQLQRYIEQWRLLASRARRRSALLQDGEPLLSGVRRRHGLPAEAEPIMFQLYSEPLQRFRLAARGHGPVVPPETERTADRDVFRPSAVLVHAVRGGGGRRGRLPAARAHPAPDAYVPFVGLAERLAAADHQPEPAVRASRTAAASSASSTTTGSGSKASTAASKARSSWSRASTRTPSGPGTRSANVAVRGALKDDAAEQTRGFLLNHAIGDLLPPNEHGRRYSNSDPVTGQAAWFDLRVRIRKCDRPNAALPSRTSRTCRCRRISTPRRRSSRSARNSKQKDVAK